MFGPCIEHTRIIGGDDATQLILGEQAKKRRLGEVGDCLIRSRAGFDDDPGAHQPAEHLTAQALELGKPLLVECHPAVLLGLESVGVHEVNPGESAQRNRASTQRVDRRTVQRGGAKGSTEGERERGGALVLVSAQALLHPREIESVEPKGFAEAPTAPIALSLHDRGRLGVVCADSQELFEAIPVE